MPRGWEGNRRSGVILAMRHGLKWFIHLRAERPWVGDEHPVYAPAGAWLPLPFLRMTAECFARLCRRLGVCPSVCPSVRSSVTLVICIKTVQARITISSPRSLVYRDKISCHWVQGFSSNEGVKEGYPLKRRHFAVIGSNNVKTVADLSLIHIWRCRRRG